VWAACDLLPRRLPLALPGVLAVASFTVGLASGDFIAPLLVADRRDHDCEPDPEPVRATYNWPLGSSIASSCSLRGRLVW